ncbi:hypothetical protein KSS87_009626, partial [Heliosperma pusillum]
NTHTNFVLEVLPILQRSLTTQVTASYNHSPRTTFRPSHIITCHITSIGHLKSSTYYPYSHTNTRINIRLLC